MCENECGRVYARDGRCIPRHCAASSGSDPAIVTMMMMMMMMMIYIEGSDLLPLSAALTGA
jgi:hypothetical protein